jgi:hypothetical protein
VHVLPRTRRVILAVAIVATALCAMAWNYTAYKASRAKSLLAEASRVRIGDSEASVLTLVQRYGGFKWEPSGSTRTTMSPRESWFDKSEYEHALRTYPDYTYSIQVNPWGFPTIAPESDSRRRLNAALWSAMDAVPGSIRASFGLRKWESEVDINIRDGRVSKVSGMVLVEGRSRWLNHGWSLVSEMPREPMQSRAYMTEPVDIAMMTNRSSGLGNTLTSQASEQESEAAHAWNTACLTSLRSCTDRCELSPAAFRYMTTHPDVSRGIWEPTCDVP